MGNLYIWQEKNEKGEADRNILNYEYITQSFNGSGLHY